MDFLLNLLGVPMGALMRLCFQITANYGWAILLFTFLTRVILMPVSIWLHKYSIRLVKMTPDLIGVKVQYFGDNDRIAEEQSLLYKKFKYNPFVTFIPLMIQLLMLMGFIQVINHPMEYLFGLNESVIAALNAIASAQTGLPMEDSTLQMATINLIQHSRELFAGLEGVEGAAAAIQQLASFNTMFLGLDISLIPSIAGGWTILSPVVAGFSAYLLCVVQNKDNALQSEQGKGNRIFTMALSVGLSLYLGYFVPMGVAIYWTAANLLAILTQYFLNGIIPPKNYIDYALLNENKAKLEKLEAARKENSKDKELVKREKADIKRLNSIGNKHVVFYSEGSGFYKYFKGIIEYLLSHSNLVIHYITSDPKDQIFALAEKNERIQAYYVGNYRLISLMMRIEADIIVMTMPDLETYQIKRSYMKKDIEYIYVPHGMDSLNMTMRKGSMDHFDTVLCVGPHQKREIEQSEQVFGTKKKELVEWGYTLLDDMLAGYAQSEHTERKVPEVLIAPSWQKDCITESCIDDLLEQLTKLDVHVTLRPHPQQVRLNKPLIDAIAEKWQSEKVEVQTDFSKNSTVFESDLLVTDWSAIAFEYTFTTKHPVLYIDTPMKVMNPDYDKIEEQPINITLRDVTGRRLKPEEVSARAAETVAEMLASKSFYEQQITEALNASVYNIGDSAKVGARYILTALKNKRHD